MNKKKIITFVTSHLTIFGGGGKVVMEFANKLSERGYTINVVAQKIDKKKYNFNDRIRINEVGGPLPSNPLYWLRFHKMIERYLRILNKTNSDILISIHFPSNYISANVKNRSEIVHIYYCLEPFRFIHDYTFISKSTFHRKIVYKILNFFYKRYDIEGALDADKIVSISNFTRLSVKKIYNRESIVHYIGIESPDNQIGNIKYNLRKRLNLSNNTPVLFALGLSHIMKGSMDLLFIFKKIHDILPNAVLLIGGSISKENKKMINNFLRRNKTLKENIILIGFIENNLLNIIYKQVTLTLFTAIDEAFGLIPLESMQQGTPVIAFEGSGPSETIIDNKTGYLVKKFDYQNFALKAVKLINNQELLRVFSSNASSHVKNFQLDNSVKELERIILKTEGITHNYIEKGFSISKMNLIYALVNFLSPTDSDFILDFGCGTGSISKIIERRCKALIGIDSEIKSLEKEKNTLKYKICLKNLPLPFPDNLFDKIFCFHVLEHIEYKDHSLILNEFKRVLKPRGKLYIGVPIMEFWGKILWFFRKYITKKKNIVDCFGSIDHKMRYTRKSFLKELGFYNFYAKRSLQNIVIKDATYSILRSLGSLPHKIPIVFDIIYSMEEN